MEKIGKKLFPIFFALLILSFSVKGQKKEIGIGIGALNYTGEVEPEINFKNFGPGGNIFFRYNFSPAFALRASLMAGQFSADESDSEDAIPKLRQASFNNTIGELSLLAEYNFFNFRHTKERRRWTPYFTGGLAVYNSSMSNSEQDNERNTTLISVPIGMGMKYVIRKQWNLGFEFVARKTFIDDLDDLQGTQKFPPNNEINYRGFSPDKDWYYYTGLTLSFTFYSVECPDMYR